MLFGSTFCETSYCVTHYKLMGCEKLPSVMWYRSVCYNDVMLAEDSPRMAFYGRAFKKRQKQKVAVVEVALRAYMDTRAT